MISAFLASNEAMTRSAAVERPKSSASTTVFKSGPLFISSKGLGWKSWKKRWFILTRTSLVFFKNDPGAFQKRGSEVNFTLGGIDLNNSGCVAVREDKRLITVLFPDGHDGRTFTLKAETSEDLFQWKEALEQALSQAPSASLIMGHTGLFQNDVDDAIQGSFYDWRDKHSVKSMVVCVPILLALEDIDGAPSFLEKALQFIETYGTKIEGILRQSADVEEVKRRVHEYEQGRTEFCSDEDAHVVADCIKHVLRELPSSPVPASCCIALLEAYRFDNKDVCIKAMRSAIMNTFPEPNRRLLLRILKMMHIICSHSCDNRMTPPAVAACMAPLLLRPLLAGECDLDGYFYINNDNCGQLVAAANAANSAQAIITTFLEEYANLLDDGVISRGSISAESWDGGGRTADSADNIAISMEGSGCQVGESEVCQEADRMEGSFSGESIESCCYENDLYNHKVFHCGDFDAGDTEGSSLSVVNSNDYLSGRLSEAQLVENHMQNMNDLLVNDMECSSIMQTNESQLSMGDILSSMEPGIILPGSAAELSAAKPTSKIISSAFSAKRTPFWRRNSGRKTPSMESVDSPGEEDLAIKRLEITKSELHQKIVKEARGNAILQASLERRKLALHERRFALEADISKLQEQLKAESDLRTSLELGINVSSGQLSRSSGMDPKTRAELEEIAQAETDVARLKQRAAELHRQLGLQQQHHSNSLSAMCNNPWFSQYQNSSQQKYLQQDVDAFLAHWNHERTQSNEQGLHFADWGGLEGQVAMSNDVQDRPPAKEYDVEMTSSTASSALEELKSRLEYFKERRSQLIEQLHNFELNHDMPSSQDFMYKPPSPPWK